MTVPLLLALSLSLPPALDEGDDQYHFIAGLAEKGLHEQVVRESTRFLERFADHGKADLARYRLASALFDLGQVTDARPHFATLAKRPEFRFADEVAFRHGQCELDAGEYDAAVAAFERARSGEAEYLRTPATFLLGESHFRAGRFQDASGFYSQTFEADAEGEYARDAVHGLAWCAFRLEELDRAVAHAEAFFQRWPKDERVPELRFVAGESHLEAGRPRQALVEYEHVTGGSYHAAALRGAGFACAELSDHLGAAARFGALLDRYPDSRYAGEAALHRGIHLLKGGDAEAALAVLRSAPAGEGAETLYWRGRALAELGRDGDALAAFDAGIAQDPPSDLVRRLNVGRGDALYALGETEAAAAAYRDAGTDYAIHAAAVARLNDGHPAEAVELARQLVDPRRESAYRIEALLTLAEGHFLTGELGGAEAAFATVAREDADEERRARATARLGWCRFLADDWQGARERFQEVTDTWPGCAEAAEALFLTGRAAEELGDDAGAARAYAEYLRAHAGGKYAEEAAVRLARHEPDRVGETRLEDLLAQAPSSAFAPQAHYDLAERLAARGEWSAARAHYAAVLEQHADHELAPSARYGLAWCLYSEEQFAAALGHLEALAASEGTDRTLAISALELAVWAARHAGEPDRAAAAFAALAGRVEDEPRRLRAAKVAAAGLREAGRIPDAEALYADLLGRTGDRDVAVAICVESTYLALDRDDVDAAEAQARAAHRYVPDDPALAEAFFFVGEARFELSQDEAAAAAYAVAAGSPDPGVASRALYKGGFAELRRGELEAAVRAFHGVVTDHPDSELYGESLFLLGEAHFRAGRYSQAAEWLARLAAEAPDHEVLPKALFRLGVAHARTGRSEDAVAALSSLAKRWPGFEHLTEAELWRGRALAALDQGRGARQAFQRVVERDRGVLAAQAHIELGRLALAEGDRDEALSKFLYVAVLFAQPEEVAESLFLAGQVLETKGDADAAKERYREAVTQCPDARFAANARERLEALGG